MKDAQPGDAGILAITLDFSEDKVDDWPSEVVQSIPDIVVVYPDNTRHVTLRVTSQFDKLAGDFVTDWEFLNAAGNGLGPKSRSPQTLSTLQRLCPTFYLSALRDATKDFSPRSSFWAPFLRNPSIEPALRKQIEDELSALNTKVIDAHGNLQKVKTNMAKAQQIVALGKNDPVSIEALPSRILDVLSRTQINMVSTTGASIPLGRHGAGAQSLSVIFLFEAFLDAMLADAYDRLSEPIMALEEPEAHLHPSAIRRLWSTIESMKGQKIIATHSGDLLSEVPLLSIRRFCRVKGKIEVHRIGAATLGKEDMRKVKYHIQSSRGELFFARCWILVEGETDYWVVRRAASILDIDLEGYGIRIVTYAHVGAETLVKIANDLYIPWYCIADGDQAGRDYRNNLLSHLVGRTEKKSILLLPTKNIEVFLCASGFSKPYVDHISPQKKHKLTAKPDDPDYWEQVVACCDNTPKTEIVQEAMDLMQQKGKKAVPKEIRQAIMQAVRFGSI